MKMIVAIVQPQQLPDIKDALQAAGFNNMTCTNILGTVANQHEEHKYRGVSQDITLFQKLRIEIGVTDEQVQNVIESLSEGVNKSGDEYLEAGVGFHAMLANVQTSELGIAGHAHTNCQRD